MWTLRLWKEGSWELTKSVRDVGADSGDGEREEENCQHSHQSALLRSQFDHIWTLSQLFSLKFYWKFWSQWQVLEEREEEKEVLLVGECCLDVLTGDQTLTTSGEWRWVNPENWLLTGDYAVLTVWLLLSYWEINKHQVTHLQEALLDTVCVTQTNVINTQTLFIKIQSA